MEIGMERSLPFPEINFYAFVWIEFYFHCTQQCNRHGLEHTQDYEDINNILSQTFFKNYRAVTKVINSFPYCLDTPKTYPFIITFTKSSRWN